MKKLLGALMSVALVLAVVGVVSAKVERVAGPWELVAPSSIVFTCGGGTYPHTLDEITSNDPLEGHGHYNLNPAYTWDLTGDIDGDNVSLTVDYTGLNPNYVLHLEGTIAEDGSISGTSDGNCQTFNMPAGSAIRFEGNHGQWVKMSENKQEAAQSRVGMPVQSKGHTE